MIELIGGSSVTSKRHARMLTGLRSVVAEGCRVTLEDGREYVDWQMGLHGSIYGYRPEWWVAAIRDALKSICANSFGCAAERVAAELLAGFYPDIEAVRFMTNGSDPCAAAVKLSRAVTGRDKLLVYGYHGTASAYCTPPEANSRPNLPAQDMRRGSMESEREAFVPLRWLDFEPFQADQEDALDEIAAVVVECPPMDASGNAVRGWQGWLRCVATTAHAHGALFVLDEVVTGFRYVAGGAAEYYGLRGFVDLYCFGKTMGNGYPVAALAGRAEIMRELANGVHFSGTFFGDPLGMAAAVATLKRLNEEPPWKSLYWLGHMLKQRWNGLNLLWKLVGHPTRPVIELDTPEDVEAFTDLRRHLFRKGHIVTSHPWYVTTAHKCWDIDSLALAAGRWEA